MNAKNTIRTFFIIFILLLTAGTALAQDIGDPGDLSEDEFEALSSWCGSQNPVPQYAQGTDGNLYPCPQYVESGESVTVASVNTQLDTDGNPDVGEPWRVTRAVLVRSAPSTTAAYADGPLDELPVGTIVTIIEVYVDGDDLWVRHQLNGWSAVRNAGTVFMIPATQSERDTFENQALADVGQGGGATIVLEQYEVMVGDVLVGYAQTPQVSPSEVSVPEGGYTLWAYEGASGSWTIVMFVGNPNDFDPNTDRNYNETVQFTGQAISVMVFGDLDSETAIIGLADELIQFGAEQVRADTPDVNQVFGPDRIVGATDFGFAEQAAVNALGQGGGMVMPAGASLFPREDPILWNFGIQVWSDVAVPVDGRFNYAAFGNATFSIGNWSRTFSATQTHGNLVYFVREDLERTEVLTVSGQSAANFRYISVFAGEETVEQSIAGNARNFFNPSNCGGSGCLTVEIHLVYIFADGSVLYFSLGTFNDQMAVPDPFPIEWSEITRG